MSTPPPEPTVAWVFLSWRGRLGRQSYFLGAALMLVAQIYILIIAADTNRDDGGQMMALGFGVVIFWLFCAFALLAMTIKRLHDVNLPPILAAALLVPMFSMILVVMMMALPGSQEHNEHGPPPFGKE